MATVKELMNMKGRRALVTGAAGKLGRIMADTLGELGADLVLIDLANSGLDSLEKEIHCKWKVSIRVMECDLEIEDERKTMIESVKADGCGLNVLINNAAFVGASDLQSWVAPFGEQSLGTWRRAMELNLTAAFHLCQAFTPQLKSCQGANIINLASIYGEYGPDWRLYQETDMGNPAAYSASKGGLIQLTRWLATTIAPQVRVNAISPGGIFRNQPDTFVKRYENRTPLGRMGHEDDFRGAVAFLASDLSRYVTGQNLMVDGGWGVW